MVDPELVCSEIRSVDHLDITYGIRPRYVGRDHSIGTYAQIDPCGRCSGTCRRSIIQDPAFLTEFCIDIQIRSAATIVRNALYTIMGVEIVVLMVVFVQSKIIRIDIHPPVSIIVPIQVARILFAPLRTCLTAIVRHDALFFSVI